MSLQGTIVSGRLRSDLCSWGVKFSISTWNFQDAKMITAKDSREGYFRKTHNSSHK